MIPYKSVEGFHQLALTVFIFQSIHAERWKQIMDRKEKLRQEKNEKINEIIAANEMFANNACVETELLRKKKNFRLQYGRELRAQCNYGKLEKVWTANKKNRNFDLPTIFLRIKLLLRPSN